MTTELLPIAWPLQPGFLYALHTRPAPAPCVRHACSHEFFVLNCYTVLKDAKQGAGRLMEPKFQPIPTLYNGYRMRSRLEARWGVFFNTLGIKWEYETQGYYLNGVSYLPDFYLPDMDSWVEINGKGNTES